MMDFRTLLDRLAREKNLETGDLLALVGLTMAAYYKWKNGVQPADWNIKRLEDAFGVRFVRDAEGLVYDFHDAAENAAPKDETPMPVSPRNLYEHIEFAGARPSWSDLTDQQREAVENIFYALKDDVAAHVSKANNEIRRALLSKG